MAILTLQLLPVLLVVFMFANSIVGFQQKQTHILRRGDSFVSLSSYSSFGSRNDYRTILKQFKDDDEVSSMSLPSLTKWSIGGLNDDMIVRTVDVTNLIATTTTTPQYSTTSSFEPVLNFPQFGAFLFIASVFGLLQRRIRSIERAAQERTVALDKLRTIKAKSLSAVGDDVITAIDVDNAIDEYRQRYEEVERLREVLPGVRIVQPPSQSTTRQRMDENIAAAQQFLGIVPDNSLIQQQQQQQKTNVSDDNNQVENNDKGLSIIQQAAIAFILVSQCSLFCLLLLDPMSSTNPFNSN